MKRYIKKNFKYTYTIKKVILKSLLLGIVIFSSRRLSGQGGATFEQTNYNSNPLNVNKLYTTPEVAQLMKIDFIPTNLYTGRVDINLPLFEIQSGDIKVPISLKYNSSGIKVEEEAANVGLGWVLQTGGNVTKMTRDIDDNERTIKSLYTYSPINGQPTSYPQGSIQIAFGSLVKPTDISIPYDNIRFTTDGLQDLFFCSAPGLTSKFIFNRENNNISIRDIENPANIVTTTGYTNFGQELNQYNSLLWFGYNRIFPKLTQAPYLPDLVNNDFTSNNYLKLKNMSKGYDSFTVNNEFGTKYFFKTYDVDISCPQWTEIMIPLANTNTMHTVLRQYIEEAYKINKSTWHLDKIMDSNGNNVIFEYQKFTNSYIDKNLDFSSFKEENINIPQLSTQTEVNAFLNSEYTTSYTTKDQEKSVHTLSAIFNYIKKIKWNKGEIEFNYDHLRLDANNKFALSEIIIKDLNGNLVKKYVFNYEYFQSPQISQSTPPHYLKRLKLKSIDLIGLNNSTISNWYAFKYEENINLPARDSREVDFMGYYNNNGVDSMPNQSLSVTMPKLYFVGGKYQHSITPFPMNNSQEFGGSISLTANINSKAGMLSSFKNPTGAINEFTYEPNQFNFYGETIDGGGVRIQKQTIKESNNTVKEYTYEYLDEDGKASGSINNIPKFSDIVKTKHNNKVLTLNYLRSKGNIELTDGSYVGYSRIIQRENGKGHIVLKYSSPKDFINLYPSTSSLVDIPKNSSYPSGIFVDQNIKRGKLLENSVYDNLNNILSRDMYSYEERIYREYNNLFKKTFINSFTVGTSGISGTIYNFSIPVKENNYLLKSKIEEKYYNSKIVSQTKNYFYENVNNNFLTKETTINADNNQYKKVYQYPQDLRHGDQPQQNIAPYQSLPYMISQNMIGIPLITSNFKNNILQNRQQITYEYDPTTTLILPKSSITFAENQTIMTPSNGYPAVSVPNPSYGLTNVTYDKYDNRGNIQQYTTKEGIPTAIIWGYHSTQPIAKVTGISYSVASTLASEIIAASDADINEGTEQTLIDKLDAFRKSTALQNAQVTTYTYDPLIGVTSITPPSGIREIYKYDSANRLESIKDVNGKILKEFLYNYKH
ncbi:hypothetical protein [Chryseobacterium indoltheticum]|uniref:hypothetical protein n=1 Tax=Chryseobacterium indoltheticum TaxID=254 RepID=UPI00404263AB